MIWLYWLMNEVATVLAGLAIIFIVAEAWGWWLSRHGRDRDRK
jgi:hypothetical protein